MAILKFGPVDGETDGENGAEGQELSLDQDKVTIGRADDNMCPLKDNAASRYHAEIIRSEAVFLIKDLGSSNGTWVNRERIESQPLADGDEIKIGSTNFVFCNPQTDEATVMLDMREMKIEAEPQDQPAPSPPPVAPPIEPPPSVTPPIEPPPPVAPPVEPPPPVSPPPVAPPVQPPPVSPPPPVATPPPAKADSPRIKASSAKKSVGSATQGGQPADFWIRLAAYIIDSIIMSIAVIAVMAPPSILAAFIGSKSQGAALFLSSIGTLLGFAVGVGYLLIGWAWTGSTPGKKMLSLKIVREDGVEPLGFKKAGLRLVGYIASGMIFYIGFIMAAFSKDRKALHDMIAGTRVVHTKD